MLIETERLIIRDLQSEDGEIFAAMAKDGSLKAIGFDESCNDWITKWISEAKQFAERDDPYKDYLAYTITLKKDHKVIGSVGCSYYEDLREIGITYFIGANYRNTGYAVEAVRAYTKYFFTRYHIKKMIATVRAENVSSCRVVEKANFLLSEKKMYRDLNDCKKELYHFYERSSL